MKRKHRRKGRKRKMSPKARACISRKLSKLLKERSKKARRRPFKQKLAIAYSMCSQRYRPIKRRKK